MSRRFRICMAKGSRESARPSYGRPKLTLISRGKNKQKSCSKKYHGRNFDFRAKSLGEKVFNIYKNFLSGGFRSKVKIVAVAKHGQNGPAATVCQQGICCPICGHHFTHWTHPDISLRFRPGGRRLKNFRFSRIFISLW